MKTEEKLNMTMLCDFYELTMGNGYFQTGFKDRITYFDVYFRSVPDGGGFAIAAGLEQLIEYIEDLHFDEQDIAYLRGKGIFCEEFLEYLRTFRFTGDIYAVPEGYFVNKISHIFDGLHIIINNNNIEFLFHHHIKLNPINRI